MLFSFFLYIMALVVVAHILREIILKKFNEIQPGPFIEPQFKKLPHPIVLINPLILTLSSAPGCLFRIKRKKFNWWNF